MNIQKTWFHITTRNILRKIMSNGYMFGAEDLYVGRNKEELLNFLYHGLLGEVRKDNSGLVMVGVRYTPNGIDDDHNPKSFEMRIFKKIPIEDIKVLKYI